MARLRSNFMTGTLTSGITNVATTITSSGFASLPVVAAPDNLMLVLDPTQVAGAPEIVMVTAHSSLSTTVTATRAQDSTTNRAHLAATIWLHGPIASDFYLPIPAFTQSGVVVVQTSPRWYAPVAVTLQQVRVSLQTAGSTDTIVRVRKNGATTESFTLTAGTNTTAFTPATVTSLAANDYIDVAVTTAGTGAVDLDVQIT